MKATTLSILFATALASTFSSHASAAAPACTASQASVAASAITELQNLFAAHKYGEMGAPWDRLVATTCDIRAVDYKLGAWAERGRGDIGAALKNYSKSDDPSEIPKLKAAYGYVNIAATAVPQPRFILDNSPGRTLSDEQRAVFARATRTVTSLGKFHGYMPMGRYKIGSKEFTVIPGETIEITAP